MTIAWICALLAILCCGVALAGSTPTPEPTPTPTPPAEYGPVYVSVAKERDAMRTDAFGNEILLAGSLSASGVLRFLPGSGRDREVTKGEMEMILGWPDYDETTGAGALKLGVGGSVILDFNAVIRDSAGVFLHVFTTGANSDQMSVSLSQDGSKWYELELKNTEFTGADKYTNLPASLKPRYVKIADNKTYEGGVAIDAVVIFAPESLTKDEDEKNKKEPLYEQVGLTRKAVYVICASVGALVFVWVVLFAIRRYNLHRKRKKLQVVYSEDGRKGPRGKKPAAKKSQEKKSSETNAPGEKTSGKNASGEKTGGKKDGKSSGKKPGKK